MAEGDLSQYKVWGQDDVIYGPVDLITLIEWVNEARIERGTWIYGQSQNQWYPAAEIADLQPHFAPSQSSGQSDTTFYSKTHAEAHSAPLVAGIRPGTLRRVKIFATMTDQQLGRFVQFMEVVQLPQFREVCRQGDAGDAMYCVLEGEVRARILVDEKETTLATLRPGDVFGEIALFDERPRSADVLTNADSTLLRISAERFQVLCERFPDLATPFLLALGRTLTLRIRQDNKRLGELISLSRAGVDALKP
jgi:hypothetical protein